LYLVVFLTIQYILWVTGIFFRLGMMWHLATLVPPFIGYLHSPDYVVCQKSRSYSNFHYR
jgi:hypothetical protein